MTGLRRLRGRYPCCGGRCRYELEVGVERQVACPECGLRYMAELVEATDEATAIAGRPIGKVDFTAVPKSPQEASA